MAFEVLKLKQVDQFDTYDRLRLRIILILTNNYVLSNKSLYLLIKDAYLHNILYRFHCYSNTICSDSHTINNPGAEFRQAYP